MPVWWKHPVSTKSWWTAAVTSPSAVSKRWAKSVAGAAIGAFFGEVGALDDVAADVG
ncbi:hypothetical protein GT044_06055 [Streptomyces sp. SID335]|uniref:hypothetical protein n=1 Tax=unclassified Streptomyces TaxID=2593676 RepID=UPI00136EED40|nr:MULTISPECIES: hypothetical protein [unclassified Streptomyces]MYY80836.1 hypothetical protein [Streptomyces sp. SID335]NDZ88309.1 hypothetical protein [Streptomyces sp. SID10115]NEA02240.1 hypothetical protein [Streptomyces sp. SID10116]NEB49962.1 hypothetical protein [Streptomyces sp. SID339]